MSTYSTSPSDSSRTFHASCHCHLSHLSFTTPSHSLPLPVHFCHCSICRYTHGTLLSIHAPIPPPDVDLGTFTSYKSTERVTEWFCRRCGTNMLDRVDGGGGENEEGKWFVAVSLVGVVEKEGVWEFTNHIFVESTGDGGVATLLKHIDGNRIKIWNERQIDDPEFAEGGDWRPVARKEERNEGVGDGKVRAKCHCGGVEFWIARPGGSDASASLPEETRPKYGDKWPGQHCACTSCRFTSSSPISSWIQIPSSSLSLPNNTPFPANGIFGTAKVYKSSEGVERTFCGTCGASVCLMSDGMVKVAAGLVRAHGARAEGWVEWSNVVSGEPEQEGGMTSAVRALKEGLSVTR